MMQSLSPPPVSRGGDGPPEDIDRTLRAFFQAQLPDPWPSLEAPAPRRPAAVPFAPPVRRGGLFRSRLALAASVALLATGLFLMTGAFQGKPAAAPGQPIVHYPSAQRLGPDGAPLPPSPPGDGLPPNLKVNESLIQGPGGTSIKVEVIDWPVPMK